MYQRIFKMEKMNTQHILSDHLFTTCDFVKRKENTCLLKHVLIFKYMYGSSQDIQ